MAPSRPISSLANGFLTLLGVKNMGKLPDTLLDQVQPTADMVQWYLESNAQNFITSLVQILTVRDGRAFTVVPDGQLWYVHALTASVQIAILPGAVELRGFAAAVYTPQPYTRYVGPVRDVVIPVPTVINAATVFYTESLRGVWAPAGSIIGCVGNLSALNSVAAEDFSVGCELRYTPIQV